MRRVVMSPAVEVDDDVAEMGRAADVASTTIRTWTGGDLENNRRIVLLSARWEADDPPRPFASEPTG